MKAPCSPPFGRPAAAGSIVALALLVAPGMDDPPGRDARLVDQAFAIHNQLRSEHALPPLEREERLTAAAAAHAADMARRQVMSHDGGDGSKPAERIERQGYHPRASGENVAFGQRTAAAVMRTWMDSPPHRKNILGDFSRVGVAVARADDGTPYWCVEFADPWPRPDPEKARAEVVERLNRLRSDGDQPPLRVDPKLSAVASQIAEALSRAATLDADQAGLEPVSKTLTAKGYRFRTVARLAASGLAGPADLVARLLEQESNRRTVLGDFRHVGVGLAAGKDEVPYWSVILARPARD